MMSLRRSMAAAAAALLFTFSLGAEDAAQLLVRRFALVVGANDGGAGRAKLKFATSDARTFSAVLREMGGVEEPDLVLLLDPSLKAYDEAMEKVRRIAGTPRGEGERRELVFYYSGHSDETGLILGGSSVGYDRIRSDLASVAVDVRVAVLDSCSSGALTRAKGGVQRPAFLFDASTDTKGHAYLTSSSAEEAAQESDAIGASFFTHFLVSGLRGAADSTGDRVVTLNEVYHFAFKETLSSTEKTQFGAQHPAYDINLTGSGDLVLTDLRAASAGLVISEGVSGRLYIRDSRGGLTVELNKAAGQRVEFGLEPGTYTITVDEQGRRSQATVRIASKRTSVLEPSALSPVAVGPTRARGDAETAEGRERNDAAERLQSSVGAVVQSAMEVAQEAVIQAMGKVDDALAKAREKADAARTREAEKPAEPARLPTELIHVSILPEIGFGRDAGTRRVLSLNALVGFGDSVAGAELSGLGSFLSGSMAGFQASGIANVVLRDVSGVQAAGILNFALGSVAFLQASGIVGFAGKGVAGTQLSGIASVALGDLAGLQASGIASFAKGRVAGMQASGIASVALGDAGGAQLSGIGSYAQGGSKGMQVSGIVNGAGGPSSGLQAAGICNWTEGAMAGMQIAGILNRAGALSGPQASLVNLADEVRGAQIGLVNIAGKVQGTQVGLINFSREFDGIPVGLLNFAEDGRQRLEAWWDAEGTAHGAIAFGTRNAYTIFTAAMVPQSAPLSWSWGAGFGMRADLGGLFLEGDLTANSLHTGTENWLAMGLETLLPVGRIQLGLPLGDRAAVTGGVALRLSTPWTYRMPGAPAGGDFHVSPALFLGARL